MAYSSRNNLLNSKEKLIGSEIYKLLKKNKKYLIKKRIYFKIIKKIIYNHGITKIDYLKILDINNLIKSSKRINKKYKIFIAYYIGKVRLIENL